jgi:hypothetical protein
MYIQWNCHSIAMKFIIYLKNEKLCKIWGFHGGDYEE